MKKLIYILLVIVLAVSTQAADVSRVFRLLGPKTPFLWDDGLVGTQAVDSLNADVGRTRADAPNCNDGDMFWMKLDSTISGESFTDVYTLFDSIVFHAENDCNTPGIGESVAFLVRLSDTSGALIDTSTAQNISRLGSGTTWQRKITHPFAGETDSIGKGHDSVYSSARLFDASSVLLDTTTAYTAHHGDYVSLMGILTRTVGTSSTVGLSIYANPGDGATFVGETGDITVTNTGNEWKTAAVNIPLVDGVTYGIAMGEVAGDNIAENDTSNGGAIRQTGDSLFQSSFTRGDQTSLRFYAYALVQNDGDWDSLSAKQVRIGVQLVSAQCGGSEWMQQRKLWAVFWGQGMDEGFGRRRRLITAGGGS